MDWLTPTTGIVAAAIAAPLLVLLYFLKLRRQVVPIGSTLLWQRAVQDLRVNAPFQRLRRNLLLLLQLLTLAAILLALGGPVLRRSTGPGKRYVLLIDRSASMQAVDGDGVSRLDEAKRRAVEQIESLRSPGMFSLSGQADEAMIVAFDDRARVVCNFTSDKAQLRQAIEGISAGDGGSRLAQALQVAEGYATASPDGDADATVQRPTLVLFSDGRIEDLEDVSPPGGEVHWQAVGSAGTNVGITAMEARRNLEKPEEVEVFATITNPGERPLSTRVNLSVDGDTVDVQDVTVPAGKQSAIQFRFTTLAGAVVEVRLTVPDALGADNAAWAVVAPTRRLRVLLVSAGDPPLRLAIEAVGPAVLDVRTPHEFAAMDAETLAVASPYDVVILDSAPADPLPPGRYLTFGPVPPSLGLQAGETMKALPIIDWRTSHAVLDALSLNTLYVAEAPKLQAPRGADVLAEFPQGPAILEIRDREHHAIVVAFDPLESNWPFEPSFVMFLNNALTHLAARTGGAQQSHLGVGEPIELAGLPAGRDVRVEAPGQSSSVVVAADGAARYAGTERAGLYRLKMGDQPLGIWAVNLLRPSETDIRPPDSLVIGASSVSSADEEVGRANVPVWPWLVVAALVVACVEWMVYNSRVRL